MRRRAFITLLSSAAAWPPAARAQQPSQMRRVGMLIGHAENDLETQFPHEDVGPQSHQLLGEALTDPRQFDILQSGPG